MRHAGPHQIVACSVYMFLSPSFRAPVSVLTTTTDTDTAGVTGASRTIGDAVDLRDTVDSVGTPAAIPMLTTTTDTDTAGVTGASRNTRDAVDLRSTVDRVGIYHAANPMLPTTTTTDAAGVTGASRNIDRANVE